MRFFPWVVSCLSFRLCAAVRQPPDQQRQLAKIAAEQLEPRTQVPRSIKMPDGTRTGPFGDEPALPDEMTGAEADDDKQAASAWRKMRDTLAAASPGLEGVALDQLDRYGGLDAACELAKQKREQNEQRGYTSARPSVALDDGPGSQSSTPHGCVDCRNLIGLLRTVRELNRAVPHVIDVVAATLHSLL